MCSLESKAKPYYKYEDENNRIWRKMMASPTKDNKEAILSENQLLVPLEDANLAVTQKHCELVLLKIELNKILDEFPFTYRFDLTTADSTDDLPSEPHFNYEAQQNWLKRLREVLK